ncbi:hypothetical protein [Asticcacaulis sp. EMRT-3]|uniref:hypothetical protein n=1 Tax=Asticcacaulis sp. EMRT-3 TaxID=3040349 RepID=UPI0024AF2413|nr:hypothetical protein [Asticcacaulis sp. EMRT-3]MDI7774323.1 hypothetical protein [Asticcacaulis sp. EMRT-3]
MRNRTKNISIECAWKFLRNSKENNILFLKKVSVCISVFGCLSVFTISGCAPIADVSTAVSFHSEVENLQTQCEVDGRARWLLPIPKIDNLLVLQKVENPLETNEVLVPDKNGSNFGAIQEAETLFQVLPVSKIDAYVGSIGNIEVRVLGDDAIPGVYTIKEANINSPECNNVKHVLSNDSGFKDIPIRKNASTTCLVWTYGGKLDINKYNLFFVSYISNSVPNVIGYAQELRGNGNKVFAKGVNYVVNKGYSANGSACEKSDLYHLFEESSFGGGQ